MHLFDPVHSYGWGQAHLGMPKVSKSLTVLFLSFGPKILLANQIVRFFFIKYLQIGLIF